MRIRRPFYFAFASVLVLGCGASQEASQSSNTGGTSSQGGRQATGGASFGGTLQSGGGVSSGGTSSGTGGNATPTGGSTTAPTGGASTGGVATGGASASGGTDSSGGGGLAGESAGAGDGGSTSSEGGSAGAAGENDAGTGGKAATGGVSGTGGGGAVNCSIPKASDTPIGYGKSATGGGNATPVEVNSFAAAEAALEAYRDAFKDGEQTRLVLRYTGKFDFSSISDVCAQHTKDAQILYIKEMENVTFLGAPGSSANFGIKINRAKNVIIRNMTMGLLPGGGDSDAITIEGNGTNGDVEHVWIDHNDLFSSTKDDCDGAGDTEFDGLIDIKKGARNITISYNRLHDHQKTGLLGSSDSDQTDRNVTFHHNWYDNVVSRTPLQRFGFTHLFNNYFSNISSSGINVRQDGHALIESNVFENVANPVTSRYSDGVGYWDLRNNLESGTTWTVEDDTLANADDWKTTKAFPANQPGYSYSPDQVSCVKQIVMASAGAKL